MIVHFQGKTYRVTESSVEVRIKQSEPRVMRDVRAASWRTITEGPTAKRVRMHAAWLIKKRS